MTTAPDHPAFGRLICVRRGGSVYWVLALVLLVLAILVGTPWINAATSARGSSAPAGQLAVSVGVLLLILFLALACVRMALTRLSFFERGLVQRRWFRTVDVAYLDATSLTYQLTRQFVNGIYAGTTLVLRLRTADGRRIAYSGRQKEKAKGFFSFLTGNYEAKDELNQVKTVITEHIADTVEAAVLDGRSARWGSAADLTTQGLTPRRGRLKGQLIPWVEVDRMGVNNGVLVLLRRGESKHFLSMSVNDRDFWPHMEVALRLIRLAAGPDAQTVVELDDGVPSDAAAPSGA